MAAAPILSWEDLALQQGGRWLFTGLDLHIGPGDLPYAQTMAFTTLVFFSLFTVFNARSDERSAFRGMFANRWLWGAIALAVLLQLAVVYLPFLQKAFGTVALAPGDWLTCIAVASSVLWLRELSKLSPMH